MRSLQIITFFLIKCFLRALFGVEIDKLVRYISLTPNGSFIIIANHQSRLDGFVILSSIKFYTFLRLSPFAFMTKNNYLNTWWKRALLYPLGLFPAHKMGKRKVGLEKAQELIEKGHTLFMFPEGQRALKREARPKKGAAVLAHHNKLALLPVNISWQKKERGRKKATIVFGAPYCLWGKYDFDQYARFMIDNIYALGNHHKSSVRS